jgi:hypothetical protein
MNVIRINVIVRIVYVGWTRYWEYQASGMTAKNVMAAM